MIAHSFHPIAGDVAGEAASEGRGKLIERSSANGGGARLNYRAARQQQLLEPQLIDQVHCLLRSRRLNIPRALVADYYISLKTNQFVVLTGASGRAGTELAHSLAEALIGPSGTQYIQISGGASWPAGTGEGSYYRSLLERFDVLRLLDVLQEAAAPGNAGKVYLLCLDGLHASELNHYFTHLLRPTPAGEQRLALPGLPSWQQPVVPANLYITATIAGSAADTCFDAPVVQQAGLLELPVDAATAADEAPSPMQAAPAVGYQRLMIGSSVQGQDAAGQRLALVLGLKQLSRLHVSFDLSQLLWRVGVPVNTRIQLRQARYVANSFDNNGCGLFDRHNAPRNAQIALDTVAAQHVLWQLYNSSDKQLGADLAVYRQRLWAEGRGAISAHQPEYGAAGVMQGSRPLQESWQHFSTPTGI
jgi:hypothetical protein